MSALEYPEADHPNVRLGVDIGSSTQARRAQRRNVGLAYNTL